MWGEHSSALLVENQNLYKEVGVTTSMVELTDIKGVSDTRADNLVEEEYRTVSDVASADVDGLTGVRGVGQSTAESLVESAQTVLQEAHGVERVVEAESDDSSGDDVSIEDLEEINSDSPDGYNEPRDEEEVTAEDDDPDEIRDVDTSPELYDVEIEITEAEQYDYLVSALVQLRTQNITSSNEQAQMANNILDEVRTVSGVGTFTLTVDSGELNTLHSAVKQVATSYQGRSRVAHRLLKEILGQVQEERREHLF